MSGQQRLDAQISFFSMGGTPSSASSLHGCDGSMLRAYFAIFTGVSSLTVCLPLASNRLFKLSILAFYRRFLPPRPYRVWIYATAVCSVLFSIAASLVSQKAHASFASSVPTTRSTPSALTVCGPRLLRLVARMSGGFRSNGRTRATTVRYHRLQFSNAYPSTRRGSQPPTSTGA